MNASIAGRRAPPAPVAAFSILVIVTLFIVFQVGETRPPAPSTALPAPADPIRVYFTSPGSDAGERFRGGPDAVLAEAIDRAQTSVDVAVYDFNLWSLRDALIRAAERGVRVRMVTDSDNILRPEVAALEEAGIPVLGDRREPLMHHKFTVIDGIEVWTGSMNYTVTDGYLNDNNLLCLRSPELAVSFTREFEEMFIDDRFGALSLADTPQARLEIAGTPLEVYFSPDDSAEGRLVELVRGAQESVDFLAFSFTLDSLRRALLEDAARGVQVRGVIEADQATNAGSELGALREAGLDVRLDGNDRNMHHKVIVVDGSLVITGSYNFSTSAEENNDENLVVLHSPELASLFLIEFERVLGLAAP
jgi:phosphatidylserine/phosphatidylglycerophosphate/cardiolipin synthase-like enzyme